MNEFSFTNKVACQAVSKRTIWQKMLLICGICSAILTVVFFSSEGFQGIDFITGFFLPGFLLYQGLQKKHTSIYTYTDAIVKVTNDSVSIHYPHICRDEEQGNAEEKYTYRIDNFTEYQYSKSLSAIRLWGTPIIELNGVVTSNMDCRNTTLNKEVVLYMEDEMLQEFISSVETNLNILPDILE